MNFSHGVCALHLGLPKVLQQALVGLHVRICPSYYLYDHVLYLFE